MILGHNFDNSLEITAAATPVKVANKRSRGMYDGVKIKTINDQTEKHITQLKGLKSSLNFR